MDVKDSVLFENCGIGTWVHQYILGIALPENLSSCLSYAIVREHPSNRQHRLKFNYSELCGVMITPYCSKTPSFSGRRIRARLSVADSPTENCPCQATAQARSKCFNDNRCGTFMRLVSFSQVAARESDALAQKFATNSCRAQPQDKQSALSYDTEKLVPNQL